MKTRFIPATALIIGLFLTGCTGLQQISEMVQKPDIVFDGMELRSASLLECSPVFRFRVANPNPIGLSIQEAAYNLRVNGKPLLRDRVQKGLKLPAAGTGILELPVTFGYLELFDSVKDLMQKDSVEYDLSGSVTIAGFAVPFRKQGIFETPKMPRISLDHVDITDTSLTGASLVFTIEINNPNAYEIMLSELSYGIRLGGNELAGGAAKSVPPLAGTGATKLRIPVNISYMNIGRAARSLLSSSSVPYELYGKMLFDTKTGADTPFPFQVRGNTRILNP